MCTFIRRIHLHNFCQQFGYSIGTGVEDVLDGYMNNKKKWTCVVAQRTDWKRQELVALKVEPGWVVEQNLDGFVLHDFINFTASVVMGCIKMAQREKRKQIKASDMEFVLGVVELFLLG